MFISPGVFNRMHILIRKPEMMADFMNQHMGHQLLKATISALAPLIEDRAAVKMDMVRRRVVRLAQSEAFEQAGKLQRVVYAQIGEDVGLGLLRRMDHNIAAQRAKGFGQNRIGFAHKNVEPFKIRFAQFPVPLSRPSSGPLSGMPTAS